ncbi:MAG: DUF711 family protein, partial [Anaerolineae bacterium]
MRIRSITCFINVGNPGELAGAVSGAARLAEEARTALEGGGFPVQTTRLATQPLSRLAASPMELAPQLWTECAEAGFDYLSLGPVLADVPGVDLALLDAIPELIRSSETVFASVLV